MSIWNKTPLESFSAKRLPGEEPILARISSTPTPPSPLAEPAPSRQERQVANRPARGMNHEADVMGAAYRLTYGCDAPSDMRAYWTWRLGAQMRLETVLQGLRAGATSLPRVMRQSDAEPIDRSDADWRHLGAYDVLSTAYRRCVGTRPSAFFALACLKQCLGQEATAYDIVRAVERYCFALAPSQAKAPFGRQPFARPIAWARLRHRFSDAELWKDIATIEMQLELVDLRDSVRILSNAVWAASVRNAHKLPT